MTRKLPKHKWTKTKDGYKSNYSAAELNKHNIETPDEKKRFKIAWRKSAIQNQSQR